MLSCSSGSEGTVTLTDKTGSGQTAVSSDPADPGGSIGSADSPAEPADGHDYILNRSSKKMHLPTCSFVSRITEANREESRDGYYTLLEKGYSPCTTCLKTPPQRDRLDISSAASSSVAEDDARTSAAGEADLSLDSSVSSDNAGTLPGGDENDRTSDSTSASSEKLPDVSLDSLDSLVDTPPPAPAEDCRYILNTSSKKIHLSDCSQAVRIKEENRAESNASLAELLAKGYTSCGICLKESGKVPADQSDPAGNETEKDTPPAEKDTEKDPVAGIKYILNTSTKKFHLPSCSSAAKIAAKNRAESKISAEELQKQGYSPCKICKPA